MEKNTISTDNYIVAPSSSQELTQEELDEDVEARIQENKEKKDKRTKWSINTEFVKWVVDNFERETVPQIRLRNTKVLKLTEEDVHRTFNLREGIKENSKLNPLGDMQFVLINYLERIGNKCRILSGNYRSPSLRDCDEINVTKAMEQVEEIFGFSKAIAVGITKERKSDDG
ncbi:hypothetical protein LIER_40525 [Lithospermum erythrorhizon]|uniref:Uncharacterized protein n=1 Tax=Lithospermum erythrorhizon TaxID=34254 RepID=A0AAV3QZ99_LITER